MREELTLEIEEWRKKLKLRLVWPLPHCHAHPATCHLHAILCSRSLMVENFISTEDVARVTGQVMFDDAEDTWRMKPVEPK